MRIPILIDRVYAVAPAEVLQAVRRAAEWRESAVPGALRQEGLLSLEAWTDAPRFRLQFYEASDGAMPPALHGAVTPHPQGARLIARCGRSAWGALVPAALAALALWDWITIGAVNLGIVCLGLVLSVLAAAHYMWLGAAGERHARYLLHRLDAALAPLPRIATPDTLDAG